MIAPIISNTRPTAASGTRTGAMSMRGGEDQAHRSQDLERADRLEGAGAEVLDECRGAGGGQLLLGPDQHDGAGDQKGCGQQARNDPQSDVHESSP